MLKSAELEQYAVILNNYRVGLYSFSLPRVSHKGEFYLGRFLMRQLTLDHIDQVLKQLYNFFITYQLSDLLLCVMCLCVAVNL